MSDEQRPALDGTLVNEITQYYVDNGEIDHPLPFDRSHVALLYDYSLSLKAKHVRFD
jgi:hypothetical protein